MAITVGSVQVEVLPDARRFNTSLKAKLAALPAAKVNVEAVTATARKQLDALTKPRTMQVKVAVAGLAEERAKLEAFSRNRSMRLDMDVNAQALQAKIKAAAGKASVSVDADTTRAEAQLARLLADRRITIHAFVDARNAETQLRDLNRRRTAQITANANTAGAEEQLRAVARNRTAQVNVDMGRSGSGLDAARIGLNGLVVAALALGPALVPILGAAVAGTAALGAAAVVAAGGIGVMVLAFRGVGDALKATSKAQADAGAEAKAAQAAQLAAARSLETAQRNASTASAALPRAIRDASTGVTNAIRAQVASERDLAAAQRTALSAQQALTAARRTAKRTLEDMAAATRQGAIDERSAAVDITRARERLNEVLADPGSSQTDISEAQIGYDQALASLDAIRVRNARLATDKAAADKKGVAGSDAVRNATQGVADAQTNLLLAQTAVADSITAVNRARIDGAESVAAAELRVLDAQRQVADAQAGVAEAAAIIGTSAAAATAAMAALSPLARDFVGFITAIKPQLAGLQAAATAIFPGIQAGVAALLPILPAITQLITIMATALGGLFTAAGTALAGPFWTTFFTFLSTTAGPALQAMGTALGFLIMAFAGLVMAFQPVTEQVLGGLTTMTKKFATWATTLEDNPAFQNFLNYVRKVGPKVVETIGSLARMLGKLLVAFAPLGMAVLVAVGAIADFIAIIPTPILALLLAVVLPLVVAIYAISAAQRFYTSAMLAYSFILPLVTAMQQRYAFWTYSASAATVRATAATVGARLAMVGAAIATGLATAAQWALNAAMYANPIGLIILAVVALIAIIVLLVKNWDSVTAGLGWVWDKMKQFFGWARDNWPLLLAILTGPIGLAILFITRNWDTLVGFVQAIPGRIGAALSGIWNGLVDGFKWAINYIIRAWNGLAFTTPSLSIPGVGEVGGQRFGVPQIPLLAAGGIVTTPTIAMIGEGGPEAVVPLDDQTALANLLGAARQGGVDKGGAAGGITEFTQIVHNPIPERASESAVAGLRRAALTLGL